MSPPDEHESLIAAADAQPKQLELVPSTDLPASFFENSDLRGEFTAERLWRDRPDVYRAIVAMVAEDCGPRFIARVLKVSHNTVAKVCRRERVSIDTAKEVVVQDLKYLRRLLMERLTDEVDKIPLQAAGVLLGIVTDKVNALEGAPTTIVGHVSATPIADVNDYIASLLEADAVVLETGLSGGKVLARESAGDGPEPVEGALEGDT